MARSLILASMCQRVPLVTPHPHPHKQTLKKNLGCGGSLTGHMLHMCEALYLNSDATLNKKFKLFIFPSYKWPPRAEICVCFGHCYIPRLFNSDALCLGSRPIPTVLEKSYSAIVSFPFSVSLIFLKSLVKKNFLLTFILSRDREVKRGR